MTEQEAIEFCKTQPEVAAKIILMVEKLEARIKELEEKLGMNSSNSSKPPSSDNKLSKKKATQKSSEKKRGGQKGREGKNLKRVEIPDKIIELKPKECNHCQKDISKIKSQKTIKRQVFDLPPMSIEVTEYQRHQVCCPHCQTKNQKEFPLEVKSPTQYGNGLKSFVSYLNTHHMLPYERITELLEDMIHHKISTGSIYNFLSEGYDKLEGFEEELKKRLLQEEVLHADETGVNIKGELNWIHVASSQTAVHYGVHKKRGKEAINEIDILPQYKGILVHDHWTPYNAYTNITHSYCNAHILRELQAEIDKNDKSWAKEMQKLLKEANKSVRTQKEEGKSSLSQELKEKIVKNYEKLTKEALKTYPPPKESKKRGRPKQEKGKNLLDRLIRYQEETLRFIYDFRVPFTNNLAERDLRMIKVKQKISGTFASFTGAELFCRIKSFIATLKKNALSVLAGLQSCYAFQPMQPLGWRGAE
jgi:transposase